MDVSFAVQHISLGYTFSCLCLTKGLTDGVESCADFVCCVCFSETNKKNECTLRMMSVPALKNGLRQRKLTAE